MGSRRANGEGTRPRRRKDGRWVVQISVPTPEGRTQRVEVYGRTAEAAADAARRERIRHVDAGGYRPPERKTLAAFLRQWLADVAQPTVRPSTYRLYRGIVENQLIPSLGHIPLARLTPPLIARALSGGGDDPAPPRTRQLAYVLLRSALDVAVKWELARVNAASAVEKPRVPRSEFTVLSPDEVTALLAAAATDRLRALYTAAIFTGLRQGELLALTWNDVDLDAGTIAVQATLEPTTLERVEVKSRRGRRRVELGPAVAGALKAHRARMLAEGHPHGWVFPDTEGGPIRASNLARRSWKPLLIAAWGGVTIPAPTVDDPDRTRIVPAHDVRFHDLRHTAATLMLLAGIHPKIVSERLGHATVAITLDLYSHVVPSMQRDAALALDRFLAAV